MTHDVHITDVIFAPGFGAFYYDDQAAIRAGATADGFVFGQPPITPGFSSIRMPARSLGIGLLLPDGFVAWGDMMSVQYAGAAGRDPVFDPAAAESWVRGELCPLLTGTHVGGFREACAAVIGRALERGPVPLAIQYGLSQALLRASAHANHLTMAEVLALEFGLPLTPRRVPIMAQSGDSAQLNVDKMILKRVDALPHGLINTREKFGAGGEALREYARWVTRRVAALGQRTYNPTLHFDVYGFAGVEFGLDPVRIARFIEQLAADVAPLRLHVEYPADFGSLEAQIEGYAAIVEILDAGGSGARVVVDERCNTLEDVRAFAEARATHLVQIKMPDLGSIENTVHAVLACKQAGIGAYVGGSCAETELSAGVSVHVAVATQADLMLAKPGMGVDEALTLVNNEQVRLLAMLRHEGRERGARCGEAVETKHAADAR